MSLYKPRNQCVIMIIPTTYSGPTSREPYTIGITTLLSNVKKWLQNNVETNWERRTLEYQVF